MIPMCSGTPACAGRYRQRLLGAKPQTSAYAATCARSTGRRAGSASGRAGVSPDLRTPGTRFAPGSAGSAALSMVGSADGVAVDGCARWSSRSGSQHHLAADPDHVAVARCLRRNGVAAEGNEQQA